MSAWIASWGSAAPAVKRPAVAQQPTQQPVPDRARGARLRSHQDAQERDQQRHREGVEGGEEEARRHGAKENRDVGPQVPQNAEMEPQPGVLRPRGCRRATGTIISSGEMPPCRNEPR